MEGKKRKRIINARLVVAELIKEERTLWKDYNFTSHDVNATEKEIEMTKWKWWSVKALLRRLNIDETTLTTNN